MQQATNLILEVESELATASPDRRLEMLRKVTDLVVISSPNLNDQHLDAFDHVIGWMAKDMEYRAKVELAERLARVEKAPQKTLVSLAEDEHFEIAKPILRHSTALSEEVLVRIAQKADENRLIAIAGRTIVPERVSDIIVTSGGEKSVRTVANNQGAKFSEFGFNKLAERAENDQTLQKILYKRSDMPPEIIERIAQKAQEIAKAALSSEVGAERAEEMQALLGSIANEMVATHGTSALDQQVREAEAAVAVLAKNNELNEGAIIAWLREGKVNNALAGMGELTRLPFVTVKQAFHASVTDALLFIVKSIPLSLTTYHMLLTAKLGHRPTDDYLASETQNFKVLTVQTAQRITRFMAVRGSAMQGK